MEKIRIYAYVRVSGLDQNEDRQIYPRGSINNDTEKIMKKLGMMSVKVAIDSVAERIKTGQIFKIVPEIQDKSKEILYTRNSDFTDEVAKDYLDHLPTEEEIYEQLADRDESLFKDIYLG